MLGGQADEHERALARLAQARFQIGADEGAVHVLADERFVALRLHHGLDSVARQTGA